ncbi:colorectal cancer associated 2 [Aulostomus maculatus]
MRSCCSPPADKPRVYLGVRVKTTVKELLQRHRAREANRKKLKTVSQACLDPPGLCVSTLPSCYVDTPPAAAAAPPANACCERSAPLRTASFPFPDSSCNIQLQESALNDSQQQQQQHQQHQQQFGDTMLPIDGFSNNSSGSGSCYTTSLPPPAGAAAAAAAAAAFPLPWSHGLSSDADFYGPGMAPCSPTESLKLCSPVDHNSYSPQDSFSSSSSSCYDSPTRMESSFTSLTSEHYHYQHCNLQDYYCMPHCWPGQQESFSAPEYPPYYPPTDFPYTCPMEESYLKSNFAVSSEMCYNVL